MKRTANYEAGGGAALPGIASGLGMVDSARTSEHTPSGARSCSGGTLQGKVVSPGADDDLEPPLPYSDVELLPSAPLKFDALPLQLETTGTTSQSYARRKPSGPRLSLQELWAAATVHKNSIAAKLREAGLREQADTLEHCHTEKTYAQCDGCHQVQIFLNRCDRNYCPECAPKLSRVRADSIRWWVRETQQAKHVVLTVRNASQISQTYLRWVKECFSKLRRRKFAQNWVGGFYSLEITNEGRGWHVHIHALVEARWIDARLLAIEWAKIVGQDCAIVCVKDARESNYLAEITKYVAKGSQVAGWPTNEVAAFVLAINRVRCFGVFGRLYGLRTKFREWLDSLDLHKPKCDCGCDSVSYFSASEWLMRDLVPSTVTATRPPPSNQLPLDMACPTAPRSHYAAGL